MNVVRGALSAVFALVVTHALAADAPPLVPIPPMPAPPAPPPPGPPPPPMPQVIQVTLSNFSFAPDRLHLQRGVPYTLRLTNTAGGGHAFSAPEFFGAMMVASQDSGKIANGKVEVPAHETVDIAITPMTAGTYNITCTHFLHNTMGMHGQALID